MYEFTLTHTHTLKWILSVAFSTRCKAFTIHEHEHKHNENIFFIHIHTHELVGSGGGGGIRGEDFCKRMFRKSLVTSYNFDVVLFNKQNNEECFITL